MNSRATALLKLTTTEKILIISFIMLFLLMDFAPGVQTVPNWLIVVIKSASMYCIGFIIGNCLRRYA